MTTHSLRKKYSAKEKTHSDEKSLIPKAEAYFFAIVASSLDLRWRQKQSRGYFLLQITGALR